MKLFYSACMLSILVYAFAEKTYASLIHQFAEEKKWSEVMAMLTEGHDPNEIREVDGLSLLSIACKQKDWDSVRDLVIIENTKLPKGMETVDAVRLKPSELRSICEAMGPVDKISITD